MKLFPVFLFSLLLFICCKSTSENISFSESSMNHSATSEIKFDSIIRNKSIVGEIQRYETFPSQFVGPHIVDVWLPNNYNKNETYAVVYMQDGQNLFDPEPTKKKLEMMVDETITALVEAGEIKDAIVVGIHSNGRKRHDEYFPKKPFEKLPQKEQDSLKKIAKAFNMQIELSSDNYLKFLVDELKPFIDSNYSTRTERAHTFVGGSSMGGLISMYAVCEYPNTFGGAICMSTHWPGVLPTDTNPIPAKFFEYMRNNLPSPESHKFYFSFGTKGFDRFYGKFEEQVNDIFIEKGYTEENFTNYKEDGGNHTEAYWSKRFPEGIQMMLQK